MLNTTGKIIKHKVGLLNLADELGNVSRACQVMGMSRDTFYRYKSAVWRQKTAAFSPKLRFRCLRRKSMVTKACAEIVPQLQVKRLPPALWYKDNMVFAVPFRMT